MKSCSQFAYEQVSDAQNWQEGDKGIRSEVPSIKTPRWSKEVKMDKN